MLTEQFIASTSGPPSLSTGAAPTHLKDATIFLHQHRPHAKLEHTLKKSSTAAKSLSISPTHIFAAQKDKALVHVYSRTRLSHEASIPFPERPTSCTLAASSSVLALGTASGRIYLWELATGRSVVVPPAHIDAVTHLAADATSAFLLSAGADSAVHAWSLAELLAFAASDDAVTPSLRPRHTLSLRGAATALAVSAAAGPVSTRFAAVAAADASVTLWAYATGTALRTILLPQTAAALVLDPADRALFAGHADGRVTGVDFFDRAANATALDPARRGTPMQPPAAATWSRPSADTAGGVLALALNHEGTTLLSGHASGRICAWSVPARAAVGDVAEYPGAPVTNLQFLPVAAWERRPRWSLDAVVRPRPKAVSLDASYTFAARLVGDLESRGAEGGFMAEVLRDGFSAEFLDQEMFVPVEKHSKEADFVRLDESGGEEVAKLKAQLEQITEAQRRTKDQMRKLLKERTGLLDSLEKEENRRRAKARRRRARAEKEWDAKGGAVVDAAQDEDADLSDTTSSSVDKEMVDIRT